MRRLFRRGVVPAALGIVVALTAGCGGQSTVSGKVTHGGKALAMGTVIVVGSDGIAQTGVINSDGTYTVAGVKSGPAKIGVNSPNPNAERPGVGEGPAPRGGGGKRGTFTEGGVPKAAAEG